MSTITSSSRFPPELGGLDQGPMPPSVLPPLPQDPTCVTQSSALQDITSRRSNVVLTTPNGAQSLFDAQFNALKRSARPNPPPDTPPARRHHSDSTHSNFSLSDTQFARDYHALKRSLPEIDFGTPPAHLQSATNDRSSFLLPEDLLPDDFIPRPIHGDFTASLKEHSGLADIIGGALKEVAGHSPSRYYTDLDRPTLSPSTTDENQPPPLGEQLDQSHHFLSAMSVGVPADVPVRVETTIHEHDIIGDDYFSFDDTSPSRSPIQLPPAAIG
jgi:hypothetical protein